MIRTAERETRADIYAVYDYRDPLIKKVIWELKYHAHEYIGELLGQLLYEAYMEEVASMRTMTRGQPILVIPVPASRTRKKMRGYNQAESIARSFCKVARTSELSLQTKLIAKKIDTKPQAKIANRVTRIKNIHNAFTLLHTEAIRGRTIIVIDDVTTTGATIGEIITLLKNAGAKRVIGLAVAH